MKFKTVIISSIIIISGLFVTACGDNIKYGSINGKATGSIDFSNEVPEVDIENIIAEVGEEIDYTSEIEVVGSDGLSYYQVSVNTTGVQADTPGTYNATYTINYDDKTYTKQIKVKIEDNSESSGTTTTQPTTQQETTKQTTTAALTVTTINNTVTQTTTQIATTQAPGVPVAKIELLSGEVVSIQCTNSRYIVSTRTDISQVTRSGVKYSVEKLIITYNTGYEQVLETIEKKIS